MPKESPYYREILQDLLEYFGGQQSINAKEYAEYLGMDAGKTRNLIRHGKLPGKVFGSTFVIPVRSIAIFEANAAKEG